MKYNGMKLEESVDYDVTYQNNLKKGAATAVITDAKVLTNTNGIVGSVGKARYFTGKKVVKFKIREHPRKKWAKTP